MDGIQFEEYAKKDTGARSGGVLSSMVIRTGLVSTERGANIFLTIISVLFLISAVYLIGLTFGWFRVVSQNPDSSQVQIPQPIVNGN